MIRIFMLTWPWDSGVRTKPAPAMPPLLPAKQISVESYNSVDVSVPVEPYDHDSKPEESFEDEEDVKTSTAKVNVGKLDSSFLEAFNSKQPETPLPREDVPRRKQSTAFANNLAFLDDDDQEKTKEVNVGKLDPSYIEMFGNKGTDEPATVKGHRRKQSMGSGKVIASNQAVDDQQTQKSSTEANTENTRPIPTSDNREGKAETLTLDGAPTKSVTLAESDSSVVSQHSSPALDSASKEESPSDAESMTDTETGRTVNKLDPSMTEAFLKSQDKSSSSAINVNKLDRSMIDPFKNKEDDKAGSNINVKKLPSSMMTPYLQQPKVDCWLSPNTARRRSSKTGPFGNQKKEERKSKTSDGFPLNQTPVKDISLQESNTGNQPSATQAAPAGRTKVVEETMSAETHSMKYAPNTIFNDGLNDKPNAGEKQGVDQRQIIDEPMTATFYTKKAAAYIPSHFKDADESQTEDETESIQSQPPLTACSRPGDDDMSKSEHDYEKRQPSAEHFSLSGRSLQLVEGPVTSSAGEIMLVPEIERPKLFLDTNKIANEENVPTQTDVGEQSSGYESVCEQDLPKRVPLEGTLDDKVDDAKLATPGHVFGKLATYLNPFKSKRKSVHEQASTQELDNSRELSKLAPPDEPRDCDVNDPKLANTENTIEKPDPGYLDPFKSKMMSEQKTRPNALASADERGGSKLASPEKSLDCDENDAKLATTENIIGKLDATHLDPFNSKMMFEQKTRPNAHNSANERGASKLASPEKALDCDENYEKLTATENTIRKLDPAYVDPFYNKTESQQQQAFAQNLENEKGGSKLVSPEKALDCDEHDIKLATTENIIGKLDAAHLDPFSNIGRDMSGPCDNVPRRKLSMDKAADEASPTEVNVGKLDPSFLDLFGNKGESEVSPTSRRSRQIIDSKRALNGEQVPSPIIKLKSSSNRDGMYSSSSPGTIEGSSSSAPDNEKGSFASGSQAPETINFVERSAGRSSTQVRDEQSRQTMAKDDVLGLKSKYETVDTSGKLREPASSNMTAGNESLESKASGNVARLRKLSGDGAISGETTLDTSDKLRDVNCGPVSGETVSLKSVPAMGSKVDVTERPLESEITMVSKTEDETVDASRKLRNFIGDSTTPNISSDTISLKSTPQGGKGEQVQSHSRNRTLDFEGHTVVMEGDLREIICGPEKYDVSGADIALKSAPRQDVKEAIRDHSPTSESCVGTVNPRIQNRTSDGNSRLRDNNVAPTISNIPRGDSERIITTDTTFFKSAPPMDSKGQSTESDSRVKTLNPENQGEVIDVSYKQIDFIGEPTVSITPGDKVSLKSAPELDSIEDGKGQVIDATGRAPDTEDKSMTSKLKDLIFGRPSLKKDRESKTVNPIDGRLPQPPSSDNRSQTMPPMTQATFSEGRPRDESGDFIQSESALLRSTKLDMPGLNANDHATPSSSADTSDRKLLSGDKEHKLDETFERPADVAKRSSEQQLLRMQYAERMPDSNGEKQLSFTDKRSILMAPDSLERGQFERPTEFEKLTPSQEILQITPPVKVISADNDEKKLSSIETKENIMSIANSDSTLTAKEIQSSSTDMMFKPESLVSVIETTQVLENPRFEDEHPKGSRISTNKNPEFPNSKEVPFAQEELVTSQNESMDTTPIRFVAKVDTDSNQSSDFREGSMDPETNSIEENPKTFVDHQHPSTELDIEAMYSDGEGNGSLEIIRGSRETFKDILPSQTMKLKSTTNIDGHENESTDSPTIKLDQDEPYPEALSEDESSVTKTRQISEKEKHEKLQRTKSAPNQSKKVKSSQQTQVKPFSFSASRSARKSLNQPGDAATETVASKSSLTPGQAKKQWKKTRNAQRVVSIVKDAPKSKAKLKGESAESSLSQVDRATPKTTETKPFSFQTRERKVMNKDASKLKPDPSKKKTGREGMSSKLKQSNTDPPGKAKLKPPSQSVTKPPEKSRDKPQKKGDKTASNPQSPKAKTDKNVMDRSKDRRKQLHRRTSSNSNRYDSGDTDDTSLSDDDTQKRGSKQAHKRVKSLRSVLKLTDPSSVIQEPDTAETTVPRSVRRKKKQRVRFVDQEQGSIDSEPGDSDSDSEDGMQRRMNDIEKSDQDPNTVEILEGQTMNPVYTDHLHNTKVLISEQPSPLRRTEGKYIHQGEDGSAIFYPGLQGEGSEVRPAEGITSFMSSEGGTQVANMGIDTTTTLQPRNPLQIETNEQSLKIQPSSEDITPSSKREKPGLHVDLQASERTESMIEEALLRSQQTHSDPTMYMDSPDTTFTIRPTFPSHNRQPSYPYEEGSSSNEAASGLSYITIGNSQASEGLHILKLDNPEESEDRFALQKEMGRKTEVGDHLLDGREAVDQHLVSGDTAALKEDLKDLRTVEKVELPEELAPKAIKGPKVDRIEIILPRLQRATVNHRREWYLPYKEAEDGYLESKARQTPTLSKNTSSVHPTDSVSLTSGGAVRFPQGFSGGDKEDYSTNAAKRGQSTESTSLIERSDIQHTVENASGGSDDDNTPVHTDGDDNPTGEDASREEYCIPLAEREKLRIKRLWSVGYKGSRGRSTKPTLASVVCELERQRKLNHVDVDDTPPEPAEPIVISGSSVLDLVRGFETIKQTQGKPGK